MWANSWPTRLRDKFDAIYGPAGTGAVYLPGDGDDTRIAWSGTWASYNNLAAYGAWAQRSTVVGSYVTFGPVTCDQFIVHTFGTVGAGPLGCSVDGGAVTNYPSTKTPNGTLAVVIPAGALGAHTLKVAVVTGAVWVESIEATIGTSGVRVTRWGRNNSTAAWLVDGAPASAASDPVTGSLAWSFDLFPPDLSIISFGVNEYLTAVPVATYTTKMQTIIDRAKLTGDVLLATSVPNFSTTGVPSQAAYASALYDLADTNDVPLLDLYARMVSYAASASLINSPTHPNTAGYWDIAEATYQVVGTTI